MDMALNTNTQNESLLLLHKLFVVLVVPCIIFLEPLEVFLCIKSIFLHVCKDQTTFCPNGSLSYLWCMKKAILHRSQRSTLSQLRFCSFKT